MKSGEVAKKIGVTPDTINNWCKRDEFSSYLSEGAKMVIGYERAFNNEDLAVLNTIHQLRKNDKRITWSAIADQLEQGVRHREIHTSAELETDIRTIPAPLAMQATELALVTQERNDALDLVNELKKQVEEYKADKEKSQADMRKLERRIGYLEGRIDELTDSDKYDNEAN